MSFLKLGEFFKNISLCPNFWYESDHVADMTHVALVILNQRRCWGLFVVVVWGFVSVLSSCERSLCVKTGTLHGTDLLKELNFVPSLTFFPVHSTKVFRYIINVASTWIYWVWRRTKLNGSQLVLHFWSIILFVLANVWNKLNGVKLKTNELDSTSDLDRFHFAYKGRLPEQKHLLSHYH